METSRKIGTIKVYPVVYEKDTNGDYVLDTNGDKIVEKSWQKVSYLDDYEYKVEKTQFSTQTGSISKHRYIV